MISAAIVLMRFCRDWDDDAEETMKAVVVKVAYRKSFPRVVYRHAFLGLESPTQDVSSLGLDANKIVFARERAI